MILEEEVMAYCKVQSQHPHWNDTNWWHYESYTLQILFNISCLIILKNSLFMIKLH